MGVFGGNPPAVTIVGHRGVRGRDIPENSLAAFDVAVAEGATWVELDARRSADGQLVVAHDAWLADRRPVVECTAEQLAHDGILSLTTALRHLDAAIGVNIEVKNLPSEPDYDPDDGIANLVAAVVQDLGRGRPLLLSSFNPLTVGAMVASLPGVAVGLVHYDGVPLNQALPLALEFGATALSSNVGAEGLDAAGISTAHDVGLDVMVWTVNDPAEAVRLAKAGVDALCTDDPARLVEALASMRPA